MFGSPSSLQGHHKKFTDGATDPFLSPLFWKGMWQVQGVPWPICSMVLEYESQHLPHKSPSFVGKYTIHGAFGWSWSSRWMEGKFTAVVYGLSDWLFWFMFKLAFDNWSIEVSLGFYHILPYFTIFYHIFPYLTTEHVFLFTKFAFARHFRWWTLSDLSRFLNGPYTVTIGNRDELKGNQDGNGTCSCLANAIS